MKDKIAKSELNLELNVLSSKGKEVGKVMLDKTVFDGKLSEALIHQAVVAYLANQRKGTACTKTRGEVSGGGRKPWRQKGTGRARVGSTRSPLWRKGGVTFGPKPRSYYQDLPKKMKIMALKSALNAKLADQQILIIDSLALDSHKTKEICKIINSLKLNGEKIRLVIPELKSDLKLSCRNIKNVLLAKAADIHTIEVINCKKLILTKDALNVVEERVRKCLQ
ncbi:MAG: 50S ribosomal protein L4 [Candidatus Omnitrophota bacterium]